MKNTSTLFLKLVLVGIAVVVLAICVAGIPYLLVDDRTGYYRPILFGLYLPAIPFFLALFQSWKILAFIDKNQPFSELSVQAFKKIKYCGFAISVLFMLGMPYIFYAADRDDAPGVVLIGLIIIFASFVIGTFAAVLQRLIQNALDIKQENDLTV